MSDVLQRICRDKRTEIAGRRRARSLADLTADARAQTPPRGFASRLQAAVAAGSYGLIAEIKKASPSRGLIRADFDPSALAADYRRGGAACVSVLTDTPYFQGSDDHLREARKAVDLPFLRKDFMLDPYQVIESRALGADCILVIMAALEDGQAAELDTAAHELGMDVLVEVHDLAELDRAVRIGSTLVGINNRNLKTLAVDIKTTEELAPRLPRGTMAVGESGFSTPADLARMSRAGVACFLVGESLMRQDDVAAAVRTLLTPPDRAAATA